MSIPINVWYYNDLLFEWILKGTLDYQETKDEYKYNSPEIQKLQTELRPAEKKFSKLRSLFRKDFRRKNICYLFLYYFLSLSNILKILL